MLRPDFQGTLEKRLTQLYGIVAEQTELAVVGSSFGGLMAARLAIDRPEQARRLILLAPALNFHEYRVPKRPIAAETVLVIGAGDVVTPPAIVIPAAEASFSNLTVNIVDDDHLLHRTYQQLDWDYLLR